MKRVFAHSFCLAHIIRQSEWNTWLHWVSRTRSNGLKSSTQMAQVYWFFLFFSGDSLNSRSLARKAKRSKRFSRAYVLL